MKYDTTKENCAENLRLALARMSKHEARLHPITFSVWYEYVSGVNQSLVESIDTLTSNGALLSEEATRALYEKHVEELNEETAKRLHNELKKMIGQVISSTELTSQSTQKYGANLDRIGTELTQSQPDEKLVDCIDNARELTQEIKGTLNSFGETLSETRDELELLREELASVKAEVLIDGLTSLINRRGFDKHLEDLATDSRESGVVFSLILLDIDYFKKLNDNYGHVFGDRVLRAMAQIMKNGVKGRDLVARYGGEEFAVLLPETDLVGAKALAEQLRIKVERARVRKMSSEETIDAITISAGVAEYHFSEQTSQFIQRADKALYASKENGRNRITVG